MTVLRAAGSRWICAFAIEFPPCGIASEAYARQGTLSSQKVAVPDKE
jgi:hypothetical protein